MKKPASGPLRLWVYAALPLAVVIPACDTPGSTAGNPGMVDGQAVPLEPVEGPLRAPTSPPDAVLFDVDAQRLGVVVHYNWVVGSKRRVFDLEPPIQWPTGSNRATGRTTFSILSEFPPEIVEIKQYSHVPASGIPNLTDATSYSCSATDLGTAAEDDCQIERGSRGWDVSLLLQRGTGRYLALYAYWFDQNLAEAQTDLGSGAGFEVAWIFRL